MVPVTIKRSPLSGGVPFLPRNNLPSEPARPIWDGFGLKPLGTTPGIDEDFGEIHLFWARSYLEQVSRFCLKSTCRVRDFRVRSPHENSTHRSSTSFRKQACDRPSAWLESTQALCILSDYLWQLGLWQNTRGTLSMMTRSARSLFVDVSTFHSHTDPPLALSIFCSTALMMGLNSRAHVDRRAMKKPSFLSSRTSLPLLVDFILRDVDSG